MSGAALRRSRSFAGRTLAAAVACASLWLAAGCRAPESPRPREGAAPSMRAFLLDPTSVEKGESPELSDAEHASLVDAWTRLLASADVRTAKAVAESMLRETPEAIPARLLAAEAELVDGQPEAARMALASIVERGEGGLPVALAYARSCELSGELVRAYEVYRGIQSSAAVAAERADSLAKAARETADARFRAALAAGRIPEAERWLAHLSRWDPAEARTLLGEADVAAAKGDPATELDRVRKLLAAAPKDFALRLRRARLEVESGDAKAGLDLYGDLAREAPRNPDVEVGLSRARFRFRLVNSPVAVQRAAAKNQVTRADAALLLYWLVPDIRRARPEAGAIASDIVDHPAREEIVRVANLGLLRVDETLHLFEPDRQIRRVEMIAALVKLLAANPHGASCVGPGALDSRDRLCEAASYCGLIPSAGDCLPAGGASGAEVLEWIRRALDRLGEA